MPKAKLSKRVVDALAPGDRPLIVYDTDLTGFGVRIMPSGSKSWIVEYRPGSGGRGVRSVRLSLGSTQHLTPDEARREARTKLADARRGDDPAAKRAKERETPTLATEIAAYLSDVEQTKSKGTHALYKLHLNKHVVPELGTRKVTEITQADVLKLHRSIGRKAKTTANRVATTLSGVFAFSVKRGNAPDGFNPARGVEKFSEEGRERYLTTAELQRLGATLREAETVGLPWLVDPTKAKAKHAAKVENQREVMPETVTAAVRLLLFTGCRLREILHLRWQDYDSDRGLLFLPTSKTGRKTIILNAPALMILEALPRDGNYVISSTDPEKPRADLKKPWASITRHAGLPGLRIHDLRHSFASVGAGAGMGLPIVGKLLGHSQPSTTAKYAHLDADPLRKASERIAGTIAAALDGQPAAEIVPFRAREAAR